MSNLLRVLIWGGVTYGTLWATSWFIPDIRPIFDKDVHVLRPHGQSDSRLFGVWKSQNPTTRYPILLFKEDGYVRSGQLGGGLWHVSGSGLYIDEYGSCGTGNGGLANAKYFSLNWLDNSTIKIHCDKKARHDGVYERVDPHDEVFVIEIVNALEEKPSPYTFSEAIEIHQMLTDEKIWDSDEIIKYFEDPL